MTTTTLSKFSRLGFLMTGDLLALLEECYPHQCPDPSDSERMVWIKAGERRVIDVLKAKFEEANEADPMQVF